MHDLICTPAAEILTTRAADYCAAQETCGHPVVQFVVCQEFCASLLLSLNSAHFVHPLVHESSVVSGTEGALAHAGSYGSQYAQSAGSWRQLDDNAQWTGPSSSECASMEGRRVVIDVDHCPTALQVQGNTCTLEIPSAVCPT